MHTVQRLLHTVCAALLSGVLVACGGGELLLAALLPGGVGTGGTGMVLGTLTGLGSVVVDGVRYDDSQARLETQPDLATAQTLVGSDLAVGQQVVVELNAQGAATRVEVGSQIAGPVQQVDVAAGRVVVWGQPVLIVSEASALTGVPTVISGYARWQDIQVTDVVQVYATRQVDGDGVTAVLRATRIEKLTSLPNGWARATGVLQGDRASGWRVGGLRVSLAATQVVPQDAQPQAGDWVTVTGAWSTATLASSTQPWAVERLRLWRVLPPEGQMLQVQGVWRAGAATVVTTQGLEVDVSGAGLLDRLRALPDGSVVQVQGALNRSVGTLVAAQVQTPTVPRPEAELRGSITSWAGKASFVVRGMPIDGSHATWVGDSGTASLGNGRYVEVTGTVQGGVVRATQVVLGAWPDKAVLDVTGTVQATDAATGRFTVKLGDKSIEVAPPAGRLPTLGETVQVQGHWLNGQLQADQVLGREPPLPEVMEMEGVVGAVDQGRFLLNGQSIWLEGWNDGPLTQAWLNQLKPGIKVHIRVNVVGGRYLMVGIVPKR